MILLLLTVKRLMINGSKKKILVADSTKADKTCMCLIADFTQFDLLITDKPLPEELEKRILDCGCEIIVS